MLVTGCRGKWSCLKAAGKGDNDKQIRGDDEYIGQSITVRTIESSHLINQHDLTEDTDDARRSIPITINIELIIHKTRASELNAINYRY